MRNALGLMVLALLAAPSFIPAQKKDELTELQRDIAQVDERVRDMQKSQAAQDKKIEELRGLIQQAATASGQVSTDMLALQKSLNAALTQALADDQNKLSQAVAPMGVRIDGLSTSVDQLNTTIGTMIDRIGKVEGRLKNIDDKVSLINQPPPAAPPAPVAAPAPDTTSNGVAIPAGVTKIGLQQAAEGDYSTGKDSLALSELGDYIKYYGTDAWAPRAGYLMGEIYQRAHDYDSATQAFQAVIDNYPGNNQGQDALFQKGMTLAAWGPSHKADAVQTLNDFIEMYKVNDNVPAARAELRKLTTPSSNLKQGKGRGGAKQP